MATFHSRSVRASQENVMGDASDKKEVQEQACSGLYGFLPILTAQRKTKPRPSMEKAKRATLTAALSISSYSERQKRANSKKNTDE